MLGLQCCRVQFIPTDKIVLSGAFYAIKCGLKPQATNSTAWTSGVILSICWILPIHHKGVTWLWYPAYLVDYF